MKDKTNTNNVMHLAEEMGDDVPSMADFFADPSNKSKDTEMTAGQTENKRKSLILPARTKAGRTLDSKAFDQKLVDRALSLLLDF